MEHAIPARIRHGRREKEALRSERSPPRWFWSSTDDLQTIFLPTYIYIYIYIYTHYMIYIYVYTFSLVWLWDPTEFSCTVRFARFFFFSFLSFWNDFIQNVVRSSLKLERFSSVNAGILFSYVYSGMVNIKNDAIATRVFKAIVINTSHWAWVVRQVVSPSSTYHGKPRYLITSWLN